LLGVTPQHFAEHLEVLRTYGYPMRLQKLSAMLKEARLPHRTVVVTFDDGYADNLSNGEPLLARHDVPATVFATVGYLGQEREFWWDELERVLLQSGPRPAVLHLSIDGRIFHRDLAESSAYSDADYERHRSWNVLNDDDLGPRQAIYRELFKVLRPLRDEQRLKVLAELRSWSGVEAAGRPSHRAVAFSEIAQLRESELLEIGAHTLTHPVLSTLPIVAQQTEIAEGKTRLEEMLGQSVCSFAYPYGTRADYTPKTVALVRQAGFGCACSNFAEAVWRETDPFELPRMVVRDWDGDEFARRLEGWFSA
jgi:peptidoglycan/xylan/chitin deacetylase (PgdA/CDA1 family)